MRAFRLLIILPRTIVPGTLGRSNMRLTADSGSEPRSPRLTPKDRDRMASSLVARFQAEPLQLLARNRQYRYAVEAGSRLRREAARAG